MYKKAFLSGLILAHMFLLPLTVRSEDNIVPIKLEKGKITAEQESEVDESTDLNQPSFIQFGEVKENQIYSQSNMPEDIKTSGNSVSVINLHDIPNSNFAESRDLINTLPGISLYSNGSAGSMSPFYMRGWNKSLITLDGLRINNPNWNQPYLDNILTNDLDRIEVVRGPQGTMHGTQAQGGLLGLYTRQGKGPFAIEAGSTMGSFATFKENLAVQGENNNLDYYLGIIRYDTNGGMITGDNKSYKNDGYNNYSVVSNIGTRILDGRAEIRNILRYSAAHKEIGQYNPYPYTSFYFDPDHDAYTNDLTDTLQFSHAPKDWYNYDVKLGIYENRYKDINPQDAPGDYPYYSRYRNTRLSLDSQHNILYKKINTFTYGYYLEYNKYDDIPNQLKKDFLDNDIYFHDVINIKDIVFLRGGTRVTHNSVWGTYASPDASIAVLLPTFRIPDSYTKLRSSYGYSVNTPTPTQLYNIGWGGNPDLKPEKVNGWDLGFTQSFLNEKILFDASYFNNNHNNLIVSDPSTPLWTLKNIDKAKTYGYETSFKLVPFQKLSLDLNYTYTKATKDNGELYYIPRNKWNFLVNYQPFKRLGIYSRGTTSSSRRTNTDERIKGFAEVGMGMKLLLLKLKTTDLYFNAELNNLGNNRYQEVLGYHHPGLNFRAGLFLRKTFNKEETL